MTIKKRYEWKLLTDDGLLRTPKNESIYSVDNINKYNGYDSEEDAIAGYEAYKTEHPWGYETRELVLVTIYTYSNNSI